VSIDYRMMHSVVRIVGDVDQTVDPYTRKRDVIGSGFFITVQSEKYPDSVKYGYLVTAAHILLDQTNVEVEAPSPTDGTLYDPIPVTEWRKPLGDGVDLAISPMTELNQDDPRIFMALTEANLLPTPNVLGMTLGSTILYIGILVPLDRPMVRTGSLGAINQMGIPNDYGYDYPAHLVDCRSYGGFSGSPCFVLVQRPGLINHPSPTEEGAVLGPMGEMNYFVFQCGMLTQHLNVRAPSGPTSLYGVMTMLRSEEIREALMCKEFLEQRRRWDAEPKPLVSD
jgi:hypothetical protein